MNMNAINQTPARSVDPDDIAIWPDGTWAYIEDVRRGDYHFMSDDYEIVPIDDLARLTSLGVRFDE